MNGTWVIPLISLTSSSAEYEDTFEDFCEGLDLYVYAEMRVGEDEACEFDLFMRALLNGSPISEVFANASIAPDTNCAALNNFDMGAPTVSATASMICLETGQTVKVTAV